MRSKYFYAKSEALVAIFGNIALAAFKFYVGMTCTSSAIMADAWHTLSDSLSSLVLLFGMNIAAKGPDEQHPFGHGRAELIVTLIIGVMLAAVAFEFCLAGTKKLLSQQGAVFNSLAIWAMIITIIGKEAMAQYALWCSRKTDSIALVADALHHRSDAISSAILLLGLLFGQRFWWLDGVLTIVVAGFIAHAAWKLTMQAANQLLGQAASPEFLAQLQDIVRQSVAGAEVDLHHVHLHTYGSHREVTFHIRFVGDMMLREAHSYTNAIEQSVEKKLGLQATIHVEPKKE